MKHLPAIFIILTLDFMGLTSDGMNRRQPAAIPQYDLSILILPEAHRLEGQGIVILPATNQPRENLELKLSELMQGLGVEFLEPSACAGTAKMEKGETRNQTTVWKIRPARPIPTNAIVRLRLSWAGGEKGGFVFYLGPEGSFAGGLNTVWYPQFEAGSGTGRLRFSVPAGYTVHAVGFDHTTPEERAEGHFRFEANWPTAFGFVAARYAVVKRAEGRVPMSAYLLRPRENISEYIDGCSKVLDFLVSEFGPYPYGVFAIVEVPTEKASASGFSGASLDGFIMADSTSLDEEFNLAYYGHEISHQWWGNLIKRKGARGDYMLDEAMAQFGSLRTVEALEGAEAAEAYRRKGYPGYIQIQNGFGYLLRAAAGIDHRLGDLPRGGDSHLLADSKGFLVWDMLSRILGREKFNRILRDFTRRHAFESVAWEDFLRAIERGAGQDLRWFYEQWLEREGVPDWRLIWSQDGARLRGAVSQTPPFYRADVEVRAEGKDGQRLTRIIRINGPRTEFLWPVNFKVRSLTLDPHFLILHWTPEYKAEAEALAPYTQASRTLSEGKFSQADEEFSAALARVSEPDIYGARFMLEYGQAMVYYNEKKWGEARTHLMAALASPSRRADQLSRLYLRLAEINKELRDEAALRRAVEQAVGADSVSGRPTDLTRRALALLPEGQQDAARQTLLVGRLLGHDNQPMAKAHVHLLRFNQSQPLRSAEAGKDGSFKLATSETGLFRLQFTGANHQPHEVVLLIDEPAEVKLDVKLKTYDYKESFDEVKIIGDFNNFSFDTARAMKKQPDGSFAAEFEVVSEKFAYQLLGLTKGGGSINGTQSEDYVYDGGGDYRSIVTPEKGRVRIVFDPKLLTRSNSQALVSFKDPRSTAARFKEIYAAMLERRARLHDALTEYKKTGQPPSEFNYDWSRDLAELSHQISAEKDPLLRQALLISYLDLGYGTVGAAKLDLSLARAALSEIPPTSTLWSIEPYLMGVAVSNAGEQKNSDAYIQQVIAHHPDPQVVRIVKATLSPDRQIMVGKMAPAFTLPSLDVQGMSYTSENLKGKTLLIDFWATWCAPCVEEMPNLHREYEKFKSRGFEILSVSLDERANIVQDFRRERWKMPWLHSLLSSSSEAKKQFEIVGIPKAILIDSSGRIIATDKDLRGRNLDRTLARVLGANR